MRCKYPQLGKNSLNNKTYRYEYPCGQCLPCRINKTRQWTARLLMEALCHKNTIFITLTYSPENLPLEGLQKKHLVQFWKLLRHEGLKFRYYAVGEYGTKTERAHYHALCFGLSVEHEELIKKNWKHGFYKIDELNPERAAYVAQYNTKKFISNKTPDGKEPEFAAMSRMPGIGYNFIEEIALTMKKLDSNEWEISNEIRINQKMYPTDKYFREKMALLLGFEQEPEILKYQRMAENVLKPENLMNPNEYNANEINSKQNLKRIINRETLPKI